MNYSVIEISRTVSLILQALNSGAWRRHRLIRQNYGSNIATLVVFFLGDVASSYERIGIEVLNGPTENAISFRQAVTDECNMTAIAAAIIAQVAITGLSLPNLSSTHWFAHGLFLLAVMSGCLAVYYACVLQRIVAKLYHADQIRNWLRLHPSSEDAKESDIQVSLAAIFIVAAPFALVKISIFSFLLGLAIYQGFIWTRSLDPLAKIGYSRDVFIMFVVTSGACLGFITLAFSTKTIESLLHADKRDDVSGASNEDVNDNDDDRYVSGNKQHSQSMVKADMVAPSPKIKPMDLPEGDADQINKVADLVGTLRYAAQAHAQCAEADHLIASEFAKLYPKG